MFLILSFLGTQALDFVSDEGSEPSRLIDIFDGYFGHKHVSSIVGSCLELLPNKFNVP